LFGILNKRCLRLARARLERELYFIEVDIEGLCDVEATHFVICSIVLCIYDVLKRLLSILAIHRSGNRSRIFSASPKVSTLRDQVCIL
jgi:hypothetical protein